MVIKLYYICINHQIWQQSLVAMTLKVLRVLGHQTHILSTLDRIDHIKVFLRVCPVTFNSDLKMIL